MTAMGKEFMKGTIEKDDLSKKRDELLKNVDGYYERLKIANALLKTQKKKGRSQQSRHPRSGQRLRSEVSRRSRS